MSENNFNPYVKKEDTSTGINPEELKTTETAGADASESTAASTPAAESASATAQDGTPSHTFSSDGQYSMTRPQGGTTYFPPRRDQQPGGAHDPQPAPQRPYTSYNTGAYGYNPQFNQTAPNPAKPPREKKRRGASLGAVALICALSVILSGAAGFASAYAFLNMNRGNHISSEAAPGTSGDDIAVIYRSVSTDSEAKTEASLNDVVTAVENSVVEITTEFQVMGYFQYVSSGAGSGVIISDNGYIITNNHVITNEGKVADTIKVRLKNGEEHEATVVGTDADSDVAVIKVEAQGLTNAVFADSDSLVVGQDIVAIGNPLGELGGTVTEGIISALDREVSVDGTTMNLLQFSAAVNPGNSGGGLFNMKGELVGIVNAKSSGEGIEGLGFAIPANDASRISEELMTNGYVTGKTYIGVSLYYASDAYTAYYYFRSQSPGLYISEVVEGYNDSVLKKGDRIIAVNGNEVASADDVKDYVAESKVGDKLTFSIYREGKLMEVEVTCYEYVPVNSQVSFE